eukprot:4691417-Lingulodinium_polyedra.AAC.1
MPGRSRACLPRAARPNGAPDSPWPARNATESLRGPRWAAATGRSAPCGAASLLGPLAAVAGAPAILT